jgi:putative PIN family toxin of toxin-antitoxin system
MLRIVLDTNVLVACISRKSPHHWIWRAFVDRNFQLCVTTDILNEYAEVLEKFYSAAVVENALHQLSLQDNIIQIIRYFEWRVIENDPDDNKFFDCAVAANADYIVTEDRHFRILSKITFPSVAVLNASEFRLIL